MSIENLSMLSDGDYVVSGAGEANNVIVVLADSGAASPGQKNDLSY